jgi:ATP-dependent protease ClpP protease subunit
MSPSSSLLMHYGTLDLDGHTYVQSKIYFRMNQMQASDLVDVYAIKAIKGDFFKEKPEEYVKTYIRKKLKEKIDWWVVPEEAKNLGLCDNILGDKEYPTIESIKSHVNRT